VICFGRIETFHEAICQKRPLPLGNASASSASCSMVIAMRTGVSFSTGMLKAVGQRTGSCVSSPRA